MNCPLTKFREERYQLMLWNHIPCLCSMCFVTAKGFSLTCCSISTCLDKWEHRDHRQRVYCCWYDGGKVRVTEEKEKRWGQIVGVKILPLSRTKVKHKLDFLRWSDWNEKWSLWSVNALARIKIFHAGMLALMVIDMLSRIKVAIWSEVIDAWSNPSYPFLLWIDRVESLGWFWRGLRSRTTPFHNSIQC